MLEKGEWSFTGRDIVTHGENSWDSAVATIESAQV